MARAHSRSGKATMRGARTVARSASTGRMTRTVSSGRGGSVTGSTGESPSPVKKMSPATRAKFEELLDQLTTATGGGDASPRL